MSWEPCLSKISLRRWPPLLTLERCGRVVVYLSPFRPFKLPDLISKFFSLNFVRLFSVNMSSDRGILLCILKCDRNSQAHILCYFLGVTTVFLGKSGYFHGKVEHCLGRRESTVFNFPDFNPVTLRFSTASSYKYFYLFEYIYIYVSIILS